MKHLTPSRERWARIVMAAVLIAGTTVQFGYRAMWVALLWSVLSFIMGFSMSGEIADEAQEPQP